ncbi:MAG: acetate--CoA ligase family protein [Alphaproteobacteria bacterium]
MTPQRRRNVERLLKPRHVAVVGGRDAEAVAGECARIGFTGPLWPVNPKRSEIGGHPCFARIEDLPEPPDAVFLAVPRDAVVDTVARLNEIGAGSVVCYTAGFGETGEEGAEFEAALIEAAGDLALVGPNCYGVINYVDRVALWPFAHGGSCPGYGVAIITQSGMLSSDLTMSRRSVPFAYMISAGNQSVLRLEDFVDVLSGRPEVRAIGLHIEGLRDIARFSEAALRALEADVPIVALKSGTSEIGSKLTVSHTGSLSGTDDLYQALFHRLGIIRVSSPAQLLETLKFLCVAGVPKGNRVAGFTCSGGGATMLADHAETIGLEFPQPAPTTGERLRRLLPYTATVSNPLDYTTPIWGIPERVGPVFEAMLADPYDAAVIVQDYPLPGLDESKPHYTSDALSFVAATRVAGVPAAVCSTLPENIDRDTRDMLVEKGVAPMQGIHETLDAIAGAAWFGRRREHIRLAPPSPEPNVRIAEPFALVDEWRGKVALRAAGIEVPEGRLVGGKEAPGVAAKLGFPVAVKMIGDRLAHKTEAGAIALNLTSASEVETAVTRMRRHVRRYDAQAVTDRFLVERMVDAPLAELLVDVRFDSQFGFAMTLASGGVFAELVADATTLLLPASEADFEEALGRLRVSRLLDGFRGRPAADRTAIVDTLTGLATYVCTGDGGIAEIEINPLFVLPDRVCAVDVLMRVATEEYDATANA